MMDVEPVPLLTQKQEEISKLSGRYCRTDTCGETLLGIPLLHQPTHKCAVPLVDQETLLRERISESIVCGSGEHVDTRGRRSAHSEVTYLVHKSQSLSLFKNSIIKSISPFEIYPHSMYPHTRGHFLRTRLSLDGLDNFSVNFGLFSKLTNKRRNHP